MPIPDTSGAEYHDFHHMAFVKNFSTSFCWWDRLLGTDKKYLAYGERVRTATKGLDAAQRKAVEEKMVVAEEEAIPIIMRTFANIWQIWRAGRKAASKAVEARILAIERNPFTRDGSPSTPISHPSNRMIDPSLLVDAPLSPNGSINNDAVHGSPSAPISRPSNWMIDPNLLVDAPLSSNGSINNDATSGKVNRMIDQSPLMTPDLDCSTLTQPSPPIPQTPASVQLNSSPLSIISDEATAASIKRKRPVSNADRPKTRARRKAARA
ncbi:hypothetical protein F5888DRAFT_1637597 [Russula emetica]|nr:hypothetical protein F5888DRAFT_1637597 [Russula emetica]